MIRQCWHFSDFMGHNVTIETHVAHVTINIFVSFIMKCVRNCLVATNFNKVTVSRGENLGWLDALWIQSEST
jgi:ribosome maturation factor RimP